MSEKMTPERLEEIRQMAAVFQNGRIWDELLDHIAALEEEGRLDTNELDEKYHEVKQLEAQLAEAREDIASVKACLAESIEALKRATPCAPRKMDAAEVKSRIREMEREQAKPGA